MVKSKSKTITLGKFKFDLKSFHRDLKGKILEYFQRESPSQFQALGNNPNIDVKKNKVILETQVEGGKSWKTDKDFETLLKELAVPIKPNKEKWKKGEEDLASLSEEASEEDLAPLSEEASENSMIEFLKKRLENSIISHKEFEDLSQKAKVEEEEFDREEEEFNYEEKNETKSDIPEEATSGYLELPIE